MPPVNKSAIYKEENAIYKEENAKGKLDKLKTMASKTAISLYILGIIMRVGLVSN